MKRTITLTTKPISINSMFCRDVRYKSVAYNEWSSNIFHKLQTEENLQAMEDLRDFFDPEKHGFVVNLKFFYPRNILFTKKGTLSAKAHDLSNIEKPLIDLIFLPCYFDKPSPYGCKNLNIDDKFICELSSKKLPAEEHSIEIELSIVCH